MFKLLFFIATVAVISLGISWVHQNNGTVEFIWLGYQIKTSVAFFIFAMLAVLFAIILFLQICAAILHIPGRVNRRLNTIKVEGTLKQLEQGYAALLTGDIQDARKVAQKLISSPSKNKNIRNMSEMLAAKVAQEKGDTAIANDYYQKFLDNKNHKFFAVKGMLDTAFQDGQVDKAIELAEQAYKLKPNTKNGARSLLELYKKAGRYEEAKKFLTKYKARYRFKKDSNNFINIEKELHELHFMQAEKYFEGSSTNVPDANKALAETEKALKLQPYDQKTIMLALTITKSMKNENKAREIIERSWDKLQTYEMGSIYLDTIKAETYKEATKKRGKALSRLQKIAFNADVIEKLKEKIHDFELAN